MLTGPLNRGARLRPDLVVDGFERIVRVLPAVVAPDQRYRRPAPAVTSRFPWKLAERPLRQQRPRPAQKQPS